MIFKLTSENIKNLDSNQIRTIDFFEKRFGESSEVLSLVNHKSFNPIQIIVRQNDEFQAFLSCRGNKGAYYLCSFANFDEKQIIEKSKHYLEHIHAQDLQQMQ